MQQKTGLYRDFEIYCPAATSLPGKEEERQSFTDNKYYVFPT